MVDRDIFMHRLSYTFTVEYEQPIVDMVSLWLLFECSTWTNSRSIVLPHRMYEYGPVACSVSLEFCAASLVDVGLH